MAKKNQKRKKLREMDVKYNLSVYYNFLKKHKILFIALIIVVLFSETSRVVDKFLFKAIIDRGTEFSSGILARQEFAGILITVAVIFGFLIIIKVLLHWFQIHFMNRLDGKMTIDVKRKFFNHILTLSHKFHTTHKTGSLISRLVRGGGAIERMTDVIIFNFLPLILQLIIVSFSLIYFSIASVIVVFSTVVVFLAYSLFLQSRQLRHRVIANRIEDKEKANISDFFTNIDSIKYFGKEKIVKRKFSSLSSRTKAAFIRAWDYFRWMDAGQSLIIGLGTFLIILFPLLRFLDGEITIGTLVFVYTVYGNIFFPLFSFVHGIRNFYRSMADFEALFEYGRIENEIKDKPNAQPINIKNGNIKFSNMTFKYGKRKIFDNFNLNIPKNKKIAFVGHSGSGKTTLVKLLYRLHDVNGGAILVDGKDIRDVRKESLRSEMSIVPQDPILFDDTIFNNIAFSNPEASKEQVMQAIKFAQLDKIIRDFPKQEKTIVGERGVKLSGGEKQRVGIARAILADKKVLVLDEATSSLDSETEAEIQRDLEKLMKGRTSIIIAHRLSTIMHSDIIVVLKKGKIVQKGTHNQLIKQKGEYKKLWNLQKGGYIK